MQTGNKAVVIALDLSKKSTGVAVLSNTQGTLKVEGLWTITDAAKEQYTKLEFLLVGQTMVELRRIFGWVTGNFRNISVALEYPVFGSHNYELGYYLMQEALRVADEFHLDVVGYSPPLLKCFVKQCSYNQTYGGMLEKDQIRRIYERALLPLNKGILPGGDQVKSSDEMDALFLGLMALIVQAPYLRRFREEDAEVLSGMPFLEFVQTREAAECFLKGGSYYMDLFGKKFLELEGFKNVVFDPESTPIYDQFKEIYKRVVANEQLSLDYHYFFPLNKAEVIRIITRGYHAIRESAFYDYISVQMGISPKGVRKKLDQVGAHRILFNKRGYLFIS